MRFAFWKKKSNPVHERWLNALDKYSEHGAEWQELNALVRSLSFKEVHAKYTARDYLVSVQRIKGTLSMMRVLIELLLNYMRIFQLCRNQFPTLIRIRAVFVAAGVESASTVSHP